MSIVRKSLHGIRRMAVINTYDKGLCYMQLRKPNRKVTIMKNKPKNIEKEFARAVDRAMLKALEMEPEDGILIFDNIESSFLPRVSANPETLLEFKRRIAENKFLLFCERNRPLDKVSLFYDGIRQLGFTNLERKATIEMIFARYCLRNDNPEKAETLLRDLLHEIDEILAGKNLELYRNLKKNVEMILMEKPLKE